MPQADRLKAVADVLKVKMEKLLQEDKPINKIKLAFWIGAIAGAIYMIMKQE